MVYFRSYIYWRGVWVTSYMITERGGGGGLRGLYVIWSLSTGRGRGLHVIWSLSTGMGRGLHVIWSLSTGRGRGLHVIWSLSTGRGRGLYFIWPLSWGDHSNIVLFSEQRVSKLTIMFFDPIDASLDKRRHTRFIWHRILQTLRLQHCLSRGSKTSRVDHTCRGRVGLVWEGEGVH